LLFDDKTRIAISCQVRAFRVHINRQSINFLGRSQIRDGAINFEINGKETLYNANDDNDEDDDVDGEYDVNSSCQKFVCFFLLCSSLLMSRQLSRASFLGAKPRGICESRGVCSLAHND